MLYDERTIQEQKAYEQYQSTKAENYHLKNQLARKNKENKSLKHHIRVLKSKLDKVNDQRKPRFRNNGKSGKGRRS